MELAGKTALVTGAGSGIGKAVAAAFANEGAHVLVNDLAEAGRAVAEEIDGTFLQADLSARAAVVDLARQALRLRGRVDILVNNAGFQHVAPIEEFPEDTWVKMIQVMLIAAFQLTQQLVPQMKENRWGRIINMSSLHGVVASPYKSAYVAAKHGIIGLTKTVALELGEFGITVNAICPAYVRTPIVDKQIKAQAATHGISEDEVIEKIMLEPAAIKRMIEPREVAGLALFLASGKASAITGAAHMIDLGWTAR
ncbi:MAG: 3-hydroxybutyrate dehydrogenase [Gammaproteobacteria bacterium]|nr:MAG: 3-hydroxybutyrate dehydrogenase [Gammaproteobacteria bacterium]